MPVSDSNITLKDWVCFGLDNGISQELVPLPELGLLIESGNLIKVMNKF